MVLIKPYVLASLKARFKLTLLSLSIDATCSARMEIPSSPT